MQLEIHDDGVVKIRRIATGAGATGFACAAEITGVGELHVHVSSEGSRNSAAKIITVVRRNAGDAGVDSSVVSEAKIKIAAPNSSQLAVQRYVDLIQRGTYDHATATTERVDVT